MAEVDSEFGAYDSGRFMRGLLQLKQTGSMLEYKIQFEVVMYKFHVKKG